MDGSCKKTKKIPNRKAMRVVMKVINCSSLDEDMKKFIPRKSFVPHIQRLRKIHKERVPLRPIVYGIGSPNYKLEKYINTKLKQIDENVMGSPTSSIVANVYM